MDPKLTYIIPVLMLFLLICLRAFYRRIFLHQLDDEEILALLVEWKSAETVCDELITLYSRKFWGGPEPFPTPKSISTRLKQLEELGYVDSRFVQDETEPRFGERQEFIRRPKVYPRKRKLNPLYFHKLGLGGI